MSELPTLAAIVAKYLWALVSAVFGFLFVWLFKRQNDTYSKSETKELIDMRIQPLVDSIDRHTTQLEASVKAQEKTNDSLQQLHRDFAVFVAIQQSISDRRDK